MERVEQIDRVLAAVGKGNTPLSLPKQRFTSLCRAPLLGLDERIVLALDVDQVGHVEDPHLVPHLQDPRPPGCIENRVCGHRLETTVVAEPIAAERFELIQEQPLRRCPIGPILDLTFEDLQGDPHVESAAFVFRLLNDIALKGSKVMPQSNHSRRERTAMA